MEIKEVIEFFVRMVDRTEMDEAYATIKDNFDPECLQDIAETRECYLLAIQALDRQSSDCYWPEIPRKIVQSIGAPAALEQLAEKCAELGQAALTLSRQMRCENPTSVSREKAMYELREGATDVHVCLLVLTEVIRDIPMHTRCLEKSKLNRWLTKIEEASKL
jgi:hypothetical protein